MPLLRLYHTNQPPPGQGLVAEPKQDYFMCISATIIDFFWGSEIRLCPVRFPQDRGWGVAISENGPGSNRASS